MSVLNSLSQLGLLIVLSLITHKVPVMHSPSVQRNRGFLKWYALYKFTFYFTYLPTYLMQTLSPQYLKLISARLCLINSSISAFFGAGLLRLSVKTHEAELNRRSLATDVGGAHR